MLDVGETNYWQKYYASSAHNSIPSQFAAFIAGEFSGREWVILDLGSGDGRDSHFFAECGFEVVGVDSAHLTDGNPDTSKKATYIRGDVTDGKLIAAIADSRRSNNAPLLFYARFLLHALSDSELKVFLDLLGSVSRGGDSVAFEYRTHEDDFLPKVTPTHFRRGLRSMDIAISMGSLGFKSSYFREGFGFAKFGKDDAHVARQIFMREA